MKVMKKVRKILMKMEVMRKRNKKYHNSNQSLEMTNMPKRNWTY